MVSGRGGCKDALREVAALIEEGHRYAVDADLKGYFDCRATINMRTQRQSG